MATTAVTAGCGSAEEIAAERALADLGVPRNPGGRTYGTDPDLVHPVVPWAKTMSREQLRLAAALSDTILPAGENSPAASDVGVPDFIDEWVSAPYEQQQADRSQIFEGLLWLEQQSLDRFAVSFADAGESQKRLILDTVAFENRIEPGLEAAASFFRKFRHLAMSAYYSTDAGISDIGYIGNQAIVGDYPGPTPEAMAHLRAALKRLGLE
jgi:hypothetical protein